jgi:CBS domain-containing protein
MAYESESRAFRGPGTTTDPQILPPAGGQLTKYRYFQEPKPVERVEGSAKLIGNQRALLLTGDFTSMHGKKCSDLMTRDLTCCVPKDLVHVVAQSMKTQDIGAVPVIDSHEKKKLIGIVTDRDLALKVVAEGLDSRTTTVEDVMSRKMVVCKTEDDWQLALDAMAKHQLRRIPVVDDQGRLAGIIAQADVATRIEAPEATAKVVEEISRGA